jgi:hypothetical protein
MLNAERVIAINQFIDWLHTSFPAISIIAAAILLESFLPARKRFANIYDRWLTYIRFAAAIIFSLIALSQGMLGGCIIHIPQNYLAQQYLGRDWSDYGLFYREFIDPALHLYLRIFYFLGGLFVTWCTWQFWKKRLLAPHIGSGLNQKSL